MSIFRYPTSELQDNWLAVQDTVNEPQHGVLQDMIVMRHEKKTDEGSVGLSGSVEARKAHFLERIP